MSPQVHHSIQQCLTWEESIWGLTPTWSAEPSLEQIERICREHLHLKKDTSFAVADSAQGSFNKLFTIITPAGKWLMRVALPVDPPRKTESEVVTMSFVRKNTSTPLPSILGCDPSNDNGLRFPWILMEHIPGTILRQAWRTLSMSQKEKMVKQLAQSQSELFCTSSRFNTIGSLSCGNSTLYTVGSMASKIFFWGDRKAHSRGPFQNSFEWLSARLELSLLDQDSIINSTDDDEEREDARRAKLIARRLIGLLPTIFDPSEVESTVLFHDDVDTENILVDQSGNVTAVLDWDFVSVLPVWMAAQPPALLQGRLRFEEPLQELYARHDPELSDNSEEYNQGACDLFWEHLFEYECGQLRSLFLFEMECRNPDWLVQYRKGEVKRDFELAVVYHDGEFTMGIVNAWLDSYERGENWSLRERLRR